MITYEKKRTELFEGIDLESFDKDEYIAKFAALQVPGIYVLVAVYKPKISDKVGNILLPGTMIDEEKEYSSTVGLLVKVGSDAYVGSQFPNGPYAEVGDWVQFNRGACTQGSYNGMPYIITEDHKIRLVIDSPDKIGR